MRDRLSVSLKALEIIEHLSSSKCTSIGETTTPKDPNIQSIMILLLQRYGSVLLTSLTIHLFQIHFVHFNKKYGTLAKARDRSDGLLVLTVLLSLSREDNIALHPIIKVLPQIIKFNSTSIINGLNFDKLMPRHKSKFFKYSGSLTTPPCSESVTFVILSDPIRISAIQVS